MSKNISNNNKIKLSGVWSEVARPYCLADLILPERLKKSFAKIIKEKDMPNLLFVSPTPGTGKTSLAQILARELKTSCLYIKGSEDANIDVIRNKINLFVAQPNVEGFRSDDDVMTPFKIVYVDEADGSSASFQKALRTLMNDYDNNCRFIFTCNTETDLHEAVLDRFTTIRFEFKKEEQDEMAEQFYNRVCSILVDNDIPFEEEVVANIIINNVPRFRRIWDKLYEIYLSYGKITEESFNEEHEIESLIKSMNTKSYSTVLKTLSQSTTLNLASIFSILFRRYEELSFQPDMLIFLLNDYTSKSSRCADKMLNFMSFYCELCLRENGKI